MTDVTEVPAPLPDESQPPVPPPPPPPDPKVGEVWQEGDPRFARKVRVLAVNPGDIRTIQVGFIDPADPTETKYTHEVWANRHHFDGNINGYTLVQGVK